jgi:hypothetical protein
MTEVLWIRRECTSILDETYHQFSRLKAEEWGQDMKCMKKYIHYNSHVANAYHHTIPSNSTGNQMTCKCNGTTTLQGADVQFRQVH